MVFVELISGAAIFVISTIGYAGVFFLMALESMITPIPSELVMPFAGFLVSTGQFDLLLVVLAGAFGSLLRSLISYYAGMLLGRPLLLKYGKLLLLKESHLEITEKWFNKHGSKAIFIGRLIPVVRHLISIPAGFARMNVLRFSVFTFAGALLWCIILVYAGIVLRQNWYVILNYTEIIDIFITIGIVVAVIFFYLRYVKK